ncbi:nb-arc and tpr domain protein [Rutstroemia sp. NJR-2017a WRK4]|nr:nb-arc and tpr domain protein [Rutstroemia sp. NJR-2017a WRK4]
MDHRINISGDNNHGLQVVSNTGRIEQHVHHYLPVPLPPLPPNYNLGLSLSGAPLIDDDIFVGRETELNQLEEWLLSDTSKQSIVAIHGLGGIGKTQLSLHFAKQHKIKYSSIIWLNAKNESTLKAGFLDLWERLSSKQENRLMTNQLDEDLAIRSIRQWLSEPENDKWLVIYDNYDDPQLPGRQGSTGYNIRQFFSYRAQGSILITTRSSRVNFGKQLQLRKLGNVHQSLAILAKYSGKDTSRDVDAEKLAKRLDGLPLALATAGAYIGQTADTFGTYLQMYEESWNDLAENCDESQEYEDRTLYSTWNLSLKQIEAQDPEAAQMLRLIAYFSNVDLWYELFQKSADAGPLWLSNIVKSRARFNKAMSKLQEYSLVEAETEAQPGRYSLHTCVHDWTFEYLNQKIDAKLCCIAISAIARNTIEDTQPEFWIRNRRLEQHTSRLGYGRLKGSIDWDFINANDIYSLAYLNSTLDKVEEATKMYQQALTGFKKAWGPEHVSTLVIVNNLGNLYKDQGKLVEAEEMYQRALKGYEKVWGPEHTLTLTTVNNLGLLYADQDKLVEAEETYQRALKGFEKVWGPEHTSTLHTINNLALLYANQGKIIKAEEMYQRALKGFEKLYGSEHVSTLVIVNNLGDLYKDQDKLVEAEEMYQRAFKGYEKAWGPEHTSTLHTVHSLGSLYKDQGKMVEAEEMYYRAVKGYGKVRGPEHTSTLHTINNLGILYANQSKLVEAEEMFQRALKGFEKAWGREHSSTLKTVNNLGNLYANQGKMIEAEAMYQRALNGEEKAWGPEHTLTLDTVNNLGLLYADQGKLVEAEEMYQRALKGYEKVWGPEHKSTLTTVNNLFVLYYSQGKLIEAKVMYQRALKGK